MSKITPNPFDLEAEFPHIARWVMNHGTIEIGHDPATGSMIRALDEGGMVWKGRRKYESLNEALLASDKALGRFMARHFGGAEQ